MTRQLATIRTIGAIKPHLNADKLELAVIDGWQCVVKKGDFAAGQAIVYLEVDSWVPSDVAPFLTKPGKEPKTFEGVEGERLRTVRLRGELSQGLVLPVTVMPQGFIDDADYRGLCEFDFIGLDVTEILNIKKYEKPLPACLMGMAKGNFPTFLRKTDQERIQNLLHKLSDEQISDTYDVTLKVDGSSATYFVKDGVVGVCSRNLELKLEGNDDNSFVKMFHQLGLNEKLQAYYERTGRSIALQGELYGSAINGNHEGINDHHYNVYDVFDIDNQKYLNASGMDEITIELGLAAVPYIETVTLEGFKGVDDFLKYADRPSIYNKVAEGVVFVSTTNPCYSFKVINNHFLLQKGE